MIEDDEAESFLQTASNKEVPAVAVEAVETAAEEQEEDAATTKATDEMSATGEDGEMVEDDEAPESFLQIASQKEVPAVAVDAVETAAEETEEDAATTKATDELSATGEDGEMVEDDEAPESFIQ